MIGRYGGEEFLIIIPFVKSELAYEIAERIRLEVEKTLFDGDGQKLKITVSIGVATVLQQVKKIIKKA